jgi:NitT/TauT family transport system substrate-binding protein
MMQSLMSSSQSIRTSLAALVLFFGVVIACSRPDPIAGKESVTIGLQQSPAMALVMVAKDEGLFEKHGVNVTLQGFTAGKFALQAFLGGSLDFAIAGEVPVTLATLQGSQFTTLAQVVERTTNEVRVVARRDADSSDPRKFFLSKRRKLATSFGGGPEFYTYSFLKHFGISESQVEIISQRPEDMPAALASGSVDAVSIFDPFAFIAEGQLGKDAVTFTSADLYSELYVLVTKEQTVTNRRTAVLGVLQGLAGAEDAIRRDPARAKQIVAGYTKLESSVIDGIWNNFTFAPSLTPLLLNYQQQEAEWAKAKGTVLKDAAVPDFRGRLNPEPLRSVKPGAVRIQ